MNNGLTNIILFRIKYKKMLKKQNELKKIMKIDLSYIFED